MKRVLHLSLEISKSDANWPLFVNEWQVWCSASKKVDNNIKVLEYVCFILFLNASVVCSSIFITVLQISTHLVTMLAFGSRACSVYNSDISLMVLGHVPPGHLP